MNIVIYTKADCPLCNATKSLLDAYQQTYKEIKIGEDITRDEVLDMYPTARIAPLVVIDEFWVPNESVEFILRMNQVKPYKGANNG